jgi:hypothetical protein
MNSMVIKSLAMVWILLLTSGLMPTAPRADDSLLTHGELVEDVRQLADIIESAHPGPYSGGGGRIAFHRRLQQALYAIPEEGMTKNEFLRLLRPLVAGVGDQHTEIYTSYDIDMSAPGGLPFVFDVVEQSLYVIAAFLPSDSVFVGSVLVDIENVPAPEIVRRLGRLEGVENEYYALRQLGRSNLLFQAYLSELVPEWLDKSKVTIGLKRPGEEIEEVTRELPIALPVLHLPESRVDLPQTDDSDFLWEFRDPPGDSDEIAYLRVDGMQGYREAYEMAAAEGSDSTSAEERARIPSATESFRSLVVEMKKRKTRTLIVDLRNNGGGNYMMAPILVYFLYGKDTLTSIPWTAAASGGGHGRRYSRLYFESHPKVTLDTLNEGRDVPLIMGDIDFLGMFKDAEAARGGLASPAENPERLKSYRRAHTFYEEYESEAYSGYYCPENVLVLVSPWTSSSGLDMTLWLYRAGATLVGTPSGQAPNSFGNLLEWRLDNSGIEGEVSSSFDIAFVDDNGLGRVLAVHHPLTYSKLASYDFDPNATFLFALEVIGESWN